MSRLGSRKKNVTHNLLSPTPGVLFPETKTPAPTVAGAGADRSKAGGRRYCMVIPFAAGVFVVVFPAERLLPPVWTDAGEVCVVVIHAAIRDADRAGRRFEPEVVTRGNAVSGCSDLPRPLPNEHPSLTLRSGRKNCS